MSSLITVITLNNMLDANMAAGHLEDAGIDCYVQDQYITQNRPDSVTAYGGIKLQIKDDDTEKAILVLKENGYFNDESEKSSEFTDSLDKLTDKVPFLHQFPLQVKVLAIIFFMLVIAVIIFFLKTPVEMPK